MAYRNPRAFFDFLHRQTTAIVPEPTKSFAGQTVIITGSNTGLGLEAAVHITRLEATTVILAVRDVSKGQKARKEIDERTGRSGIIEIWQLDMASYESVKAFASRIQGMERLDALLLNAGIYTEKWSMAEDNELSLTVNFINTMFLAVASLPKLRESASKYGITPRVTIVSSLVHHYTTLSAKSNPKILESMNDKSKASLKTRYMDSKLLQILYCEELVPAMKSSGKGAVTLNLVDPGYCYSSVFRENEHVGIKLSLKALGRPTEVGSRTLVLAVEAGNEATDGKYMSDGIIAPTSRFVQSKEGAETARRVWTELNEKLEAIQPGVTKYI